MSKYRFYRNSWIFLEENKEQLLTKKEARALLEEKGLIVRNTYDFDTKDDTSFWFVIKDKLEDISELPFSARRNIRRSQKFYNFKKSDRNFVRNNCYDIFLSRQKTYRVKNHIVTKEEFELLIDEYEHENIIDYWVVEDKETNEIIGFSINRVKSCSCDYDLMCCSPDSLRNRTYPYYGLIYSMNQYYLGDKKLKYVCDGSRTITEHSNIQDYLIYNFKFRKAYCKLKVHYKWWLGVVIKLLFPFRNIIPLRNVRAILKMEECSHNSQ